MIHLLIQKIITKWLMSLTIFLVIFLGIHHCLDYQMLQIVCLESTAIQILLEQQLESSCDSFNWCVNDSFSCSNWCMDSSSFSVSCGNLEFNSNLFVLIAESLQVFICYIEFPCIYIYLSVTLCVCAAHLVYPSIWV